MAAALRTSIAKLVPGRRLLPAMATQLQQNCQISCKALRDLHGVQRPPPFDYKNKNYTMFSAIFDKTHSRIDENSKVILVEGPVAAGKSAFAEELAKELDMLYVPEANMDMYYINPYGYDMRQLDPDLPEDTRSFDTNNFLRDPKHRNVGFYQLHMYKLRYAQYVDALAHVLNTGQGVVLDRSCYSDAVFVEAMFKNNCLSKQFHRAYYEIRENTIPLLLKPHLVIYLDVPVNTVQQRIKERKIEAEVKSPVFQTDKYLTDIETNYKQVFLKDISIHAELLVYDWSNGGEIEIIVEDIERIDFNRFDKHDAKVKDWRFMPKEIDWAEARVEYTNNKHLLMSNMDLPIYYCPEMLVQPDDAKLWYEQWFSAPGMKYRKGFNADMGDTGLLFKEKTNKADSIV